ncbi:MAG: hypothetical protein JO152_12810, partial [Mycobacteriaceae bacterium]|nr:hypothetical protein [Mycobacteriaceae bacterium]
VLGQRMLLLEHTGRKTGQRPAVSRDVAPSRASAKATLDQPTPALPMFRLELQRR